VTDRQISFNSKYCKSAQHRTGKNLISTEVCRQLKTHTLVYCSTEHTCNTSWQHSPCASLADADAVNEVVIISLQRSDFCGSRSTIQPDIQLTIPQWHGVETLDKSSHRSSEMAKQCGYTVLAFNQPAGPSVTRVFIKHLFVWL